MQRRCSYLSYKLCREICMNQLAGGKHMENNCFLRTFKFEMLIQCNLIIHSLYSSSCIHVTAFLLVLAQKVPHLMGQSSSTCILVVDLIVYLELHLLCALTSVYSETESLRQKAEKWHEMDHWDRAQKGTICALDQRSPCSFQSHRESTVGMGFWRVKWGCSN
jgi:hypothetical protein